jgi:hypothetical protein
METLHWRGIQLAFIQNVRHFIFTSLRCLATKISSTWHTRWGVDWSVDNQVLESVFFALLICFFCMQNIDEKESRGEISVAGAGYLHFLPEQGDFKLYTVLA